MKREFGPNFLVTDKKVPSDFFETMLKSITSTIEETRMMPQDKLSVDCDSDLSTN